jgi:hypothetical protein
MKAEYAPIAINSSETINANTPVPPLPYLNNSETRIKPLKPKKSTIDPMISTIAKIGCMMRNNLRLPPGRHTPVMPE